MPNDAVPLTEIRRALVVKLRHHGDVLLTSPVFSALHAAVPGIEIDALVYADTREMLAGHPAIAQLHTIDRRWKQLGAVGQLRAEWALLRELRERRYDLLVHLTEHRRGAWLARLLRPAFSVAPRVRGRGDNWSKAFTHLYPRSNHPLRHTVESNLDALRRLGLRPGPDRRLTLVPGAAAEQRVAALLGERGVGAFAHLHPASRWLFKCWTAAGWAATIARCDAAGLRVVLSCAPDPAEQALVADIVAALPPALAAKVVDLGGALSLKDLAALAARARIFLGVDSAPMHVAAAVGTPVVALFGPSGDVEWGPWAVPCRVVTSTAHRCRPCGLDGCGGGKISECLTTLPADAVWAAVEALLAETDS